MNFLISVELKNSHVNTPAAKLAFNTAINAFEKINLFSKKMNEKGDI